MRQPEPRCTTEQLLERWKSDRNPDDYWSLLEHLYPRLHHRIRTLYFRLGPRRHATSPTSLLDRTFLLVIESPNKLVGHDLTVDSILKQLEGIAVLESKNLVRKAHTRLRPLHGPDGSPASPVQDLEAKTSAYDSNLDDVVDSLPAAIQRDVAVLLLDGNTEYEVAYILGVNVESVRDTTKTICILLNNRSRRAD